jgi:hypothetical protein
LSYIPIIAGQKDLTAPIEAPVADTPESTLPATYELEQGLSFSSKAEQQQMGSSSDKIKGKKKRGRQ